MNVYWCATTRGLQTETRVIEKLITNLGLHTWTLERSRAGTVDRNFYQAAYDEMQKADVFIGIFAHIYGWIPEKDWYGQNTTDGEISFPHMEYQWAVARKIPRLIFFASEKDANGNLIVVPDEDREDDPQKIRKLKDFKRQIMKTDNVEYYQSVEDLKKKTGPWLIRTTHQLHFGNKENRNIIFISHATKDDKFVSELSQKLEEAGSYTWVDHFHILPGADWDSALEYALDASDALIVVLTPDANQSLVVKAEWSYFGESGKKLYPIILNDTSLPFRLHVLQYIDFRQEREKAFKNLLKALNLNSETTSWTD
jgi:hypothetical protein